MYNTKKINFDDLDYIFSLTLSSPLANRQTVNGYKGVRYLWLGELYQAKEGQDVSICDKTNRLSLD